MALKTNENLTFELIFLYKMLVAVVDGRFTCRMDTNNYIRARINFVYAWYSKSCIIQSGDCDETICSMRHSDFDVVLSYRAV